MGILRREQHDKKNTNHDSGQSTVEYLIVTFLFVAVLIYPTSIYDTISGTLKSKYRSYAFAVAISDPPRKQFDDKLGAVADKIGKVQKTVEEIEDLLGNKKNFPLPYSGTLPSFGDINIGEIVEKEF